MLKEANEVGRDPLIERDRLIGHPTVGELMTSALSDREHDVFPPAREVVIEQIARDPGPIRDLVEREPGYSVLGDERHSYLDQLLAPRVMGHAARRALRAWL